MKELTIGQLACSSCEVQVLDMQDSTVAARAKTLGIRSLPAVAINGQLADCCAERGLDENKLRAAVAANCLTAACDQHHGHR